MTLQFSFPLVWQPWRPCVCMSACSVIQLNPTPCHPMDYSPPGSSVHGILQARLLEWVAISFSRGSSWPRDQTTSLTSSALEGRFFTPLPPGKLELSVGIFICKWKEWTLNNLCRKDRWINNQSQGYGTKDIHFLFIDIYFHAPALNTSIPRGESRIYRPVCSPIPRDRTDSSDFNITYMVMTLIINISSPN